MLEFKAKTQKLEGVISTAVTAVSAITLTRLKF